MSNQRHEIQNAVRVILSRVDDLIHQQCALRLEKAALQRAHEQALHKNSATALVWGFLAGAFMTGAVMGAAWVWLL